MDGRAVNPTADFPGLARTAAISGAILIAAAALGGVFILAAGVDPLAAYGALIGHALGTANGFNEVVVRAIPLTLAGLGIAIAFRANVFNIGADGQIVIGAVGAFWITAAVGPGPAWIAVLWFLGLGAAFGAAYGGLAGWLRARWNANEIIVTIMLNYIALQLLGWAVRGPLQEGIGIWPRSDRIPDILQFDLVVAQSRVHEGLFVAVAATIVVFVLLRYTAFGFQLRAVGINPFAARYGGTDDRRVILLAMAMSGALAGLAGAVEIAGIHHRLQDNFAPGFGITAIAVALLARLNPLGVPLAALLFGVLHVGSGVLQRESAVPFPIVWVIEGLVILAVLIIGVAAARRG